MKLNEQKLLEAGWVEDYKNKGLWIPAFRGEKECKRYEQTGGYSTDFALGIQRERELIEKNGAAYKASQSYQHMYGYEIGVRKALWGPIFSTEYVGLEREEAKKIVKLLNDGKKVAIPEETQYEVILVLKEKYCERYYIVPTYAILKQKMIQIFKNRIADGCWYEYCDLKPVVVPDISLEEAGKFSNVSLRESVEKAWAEYERALKWNEDTAEERQLYDKALVDEDGRDVIRFLESRRHSEYEGFELIECD